MYRSVSLIAAVVCLLFLESPVLAAQITGDYVETRSADVYTGPCFANGEVGLTGNEATLAWHVRKGEWNGVSLDDLSVVAVTKANSTLGDPYHNPYPARSVLILDARASETQRLALISLAQAMGGRLLENIRLIRLAPISMEVGEGSDHGSVTMRAGDLALIKTRALNDKDHFCGNEITYYPPLAELSHAMPAVAIWNEYMGNDLGAEWKIFDKRSAFVGSFAR